MSRLAFATLLVLCVAPYLGVLEAPFLDLDDHWLVAGNPYILHADVGAILDPSSPRPHLGGEYLPVRDLVAATVVAIAGPSAFAFHLVSLLLHAACAAVVYWLALGLFGGGRGPLLAAAFFGLHPLATEPVCWISSHKDLLMTLLAGASLALYLSRRPGRYAASFALFVAALFAKATAVAFPLALVLTVLATSERPARRPMLLGAIPFLATALLAALVHATHYGAGGLGAAPLGVEEWGCRLLTGVFHSLRLLVLPVGQNVLYPASWEGTGPHWAVPALALAIVFPLCLAMRAPERVLAILWPLVFLAPLFAPVSRSSSLVAERYLYPALVGPALAFGAIAATATSRRRLAACALLVASLVPLTVWRARDWYTPGTLWQSALFRDPENPRAHLHLGRAHEAAGDLDGALDHLGAAVRLAPEDARARHALATVLARQGRAGEAIEQLRAAVRIDPLFGQARVNLGTLLALAGEVRRARRQLRIAAGASPELAAVHNQLGVLSLQEGRAEEALAHLGRALERVPRRQRAGILVNRAIALQALRRWNEALRALDEALFLDPGHVRALSERRRVLRDRR